MSEHGFMQPNPALLDLEQRKKKSGLAHELGLGAACTKCGDGCTGFELHFWRKVCINCRCGKLEHNVKEEEDYGFSFVGKIFDRPLRTKADECKFIYGDIIEDNNDDAADAEEEVVLDWAPPGVSSILASKYLRSLPDGHVSIQGSEGAVRRKKQLEKQFPLHDVEPGQCHQLTQGEIDTMTSYVDNVKKNVVGQGILHELGIGVNTSKYDLEDDLYDLPPPLPSSHLPGPHISSSSPLPLPPPPMDLLNLDTLSYSLPSPPDRSVPAKTHPKMEETGVLHNINEHSRKPNSIHSTSSPNKGLHLTNAPHYEHSIPSRPDLTNPDSSSSTKLVYSGQKPGGWSCCGCGQSMYPGEIAIFAERAGQDKCWHPSCFSCTQCGEMLEDLLYFYSKGQLYCGRDFAQLMSIPRCSACDELIFSTEYTGAEDSFWHIKHFCCLICDSPLAGQKYIPVEGQPHCLACWQERHGKVCSACGDYIDPQGQRVSLGENHWHANASCFKCGVCQASLLGGKMSRRQGTLLCSSRCGQVMADKKEQQERESQMETPKSVYKVSYL